MKFVTMISTTLAVSLAAISFAQTKITPKTLPVSMTKAQWEEMYKGAEAAFDRMDANAIFAYMTPDGTITMGGKTMNVKDAKTSMKTWFAMMKDLHCSMKITKITQAGMKAIIVDDFNNSGTTKPDPKTKKTAKVVDKGTETIYWVTVKGKWMIRKIVSTNEKITMDGKPVKM